MVFVSAQANRFAQPRGYAGGAASGDPFMRASLTLHPESLCQAVTQIVVDVARAGLTLHLRYIVTCAFGGLRLPPMAAPARADELWNHTCFEAFIKPVEGEPYCEFNFSPSKQWAAYAFSGRRAGMEDIEPFPVPRIETRVNNGNYELEASLELESVPKLRSSPAWRIGLSAVIEESNGYKSWWALAHADGKPDFHHVANFALALGPDGQPV